MRTYNDYVNEVRAVMGLGPLKRVIKNNNLKEENAKLKKELRKAKDKNSILKQMYNTEIINKDK